MGTTAPSTSQAETPNGIALVTRTPIAIKGGGPGTTPTASALLSSSTATKTAAVRVGRTGASRANGVGPGRTAAVCTPATGLCHHAATGGRPSSTTYVAAVDGAGPTVAAGRGADALPTGVGPAISVRMLTRGRASPFAGVSADASSIAACCPSSPASHPASASATSAAVAPAAVRAVSTATFVSVIVYDGTAISCRSRPPPSAAFTVRAITVSPVFMACVAGPGTRKASPGPSCAARAAVGPVITGTSVSPSASSAGARCRSRVSRPS